MAKETISPDTQASNRRRRPEIASFSVYIYIEILINMIIAKKLSTTVKTSTLMKLMYLPYE